MLRRYNKIKNFSKKFKFFKFLAHELVNKHIHYIEKAKPIYIYNIYKYILYTYIVYIFLNLFIINLYTLIF